MQKKKVYLGNKGMDQDTSISKQNNTCAWENFNIRITTEGEGSQLSITNERGNKAISIQDESTGEEVSLPENLIGKAVLNDYLVLFCKDSDNDYIYRIKCIENSDIFYGKLLYKGNLNFSLDYPIETLTYYESEDIQKVYWIDGINQPRLINIMDDYSDADDTRFDFLTTINFFDSANDVVIDKTFAGTSYFPAGTIQYFITYQYKFGQETNIVYASPLYYMSDSERGTAADKTAGCAFEIAIKNIDTKFDYINIYCIIRTTASGTPVGYKVASFSTTTSLTYTDVGSYQETFDISTLIFMGGHAITAQTIEQKDDILFLGNINVSAINVIQEIKEAFDKTIKEDGTSSIVKFVYGDDDDFKINNSSPTGLYSYYNQLNDNSFSICTYKGGEKYRFGVQFVTATGERSSAYWVGDVTNTLYPLLQTTSIKKAIAQFTIPSEIISLASEYGYVGVVPLRAIAGDADRVIIGQGILNPTVFNLKQRFANAPYSMSSWFFRPKNNNKITYNHFDPLPANNSFSCEIQNNTLKADENLTPYYNFEDATKLAYIIRHFYVESNDHIASRWARMYVIEESIDTNGNSTFSGKKYETGKHNGAVNSTTTHIKSCAKELYANMQQAGIKEQYIPSYDTLWENADEIRKGEFYTNRDYSQGTSANYSWSYCVERDSTFFVDENMVTFNSPDITSSNKNKLQRQLKMRVIGYVSLSANMISNYFDIEKTSESDYTTGGYNFITPNITYYPEEYPTFPYIETNLPIGELQSSTTGVLIYPWHKTGYIYPKEENHDEDETNVDYLKLNSKTLATLRYAYYTTYLWTDDNIEINKYGLEDIQYGDDDTDAQVLLANNAQRLYYNNYDFILPTALTTYNEDTEKEEIGMYDLYNTGLFNFTFDKDQLQSLSESDALYSYRQVNDPVNIAAKSTGHAVLSLANDENGNAIILPTVVGEDDSDDGNNIYLNGENLILPWETYLAPYILYTIISKGEEPAYPVYKATGENNNIYYLTEFDDAQRALDDLNSRLETASQTIDQTVQEKVGILLDTGDGRILLYGINGFELKQIGEDIIKECQFNLTATSRRTDDQQIDNFIITIINHLFTWDEANSYTVKIETTVDNTSYTGEITYSTTDESINKEWTFPFDVSKHGTDPVFSFKVSVVINEETVYEAEDIRLGVSEDTEQPFEINKSEEAEKRVAVSVDPNTFAGISPIYISSGQYWFILEDGVLQSAAISVATVIQPKLKDTSANQLSQKTSYLLIGELYRDLDLSNEDTRYGGIGENAIENNTFIPAGFLTIINNNNSDLVILAPEGDSYFQRYDILKTYPYSDGKENNIIEILSCMLESRTNIAGRTDVQRILSDYTLVDNTVYNSFNMAYTQEDTLISTNVLDNKYTLSTFPTEITWTEAKIPTAEKDSWTNITLFNTLFMDGNKGAVRALTRFNNEIFCFQDTGIAQLLYNTRTALSTQEGSQIELGLSGLVEGKRYLSESDGCVNKWSIATGNSGIFFIDAKKHRANILTTETIVDISEKYNFKDWFKAETSSDIWTPNEFKDFIVFVDKKNNDVYFVQSPDNVEHNVLCFNESLQQFTSFYNYGKILMLTNVVGRTFTWRDNKLWAQGEGLYSHLYGEYQNYYIIYRVTPSPFSDKIFTNIEYRGDIFDVSNNNKLTNFTFDKLNVWNEYQNSSIDLLRYFINKYPDKRLKYRIWRCDIPRDSINNNNKYGLNRIRNPWIYIQLIKNNTNLRENTNERMELHDVMVIYYE